jgi:hypothetical protein
MSVARDSTPGGFLSRGIVVSLLLNAAVPAILYALTKSYYSSSEVVALSVAAVFPLVVTAVELGRHRKLDIIGTLALLGIAVSLGGVALGGDPRIILIRESFLTAALGVACFVSLLFPLPLMYYFGREFAAGNDPVKLAEYNAQALIPGAVRVHRRITLVWGCVYSGEFALRVLMVYTLPTVVVLSVSPFIFAGATFGTIAWTFAYVRRVRRRAAARLAASELGTS